VHFGSGFNITRFPSEKSSEAHLCRAMVEFSDFISEQGLIDLPIVGGSFTWLNSWDVPSWSRIWGRGEDCRIFKFENLWLKSEGFVD
jgi:hypothetical protein